MKTLSNKLCTLGPTHAHWCPACKELHGFWVDKPNPDNGARWTFDGNLDVPTFNPSMNIRAEFAPEDGGPFVCHYFLKNGVIQYLNDCTHEMAGKEIPLPDLPAWAQSRR